MKKLKVIIAGLLTLIILFAGFSALGKFGRNIKHVHMKEKQKAGTLIHHLIY